MRILLGALITLMLGPASAPHAAETWRFDPAACKAGAPNKMYVALGPNVLAIDSKANPAIGSPLYPQAGDRALTPPDPSEPVGCYGNPRQLGDLGSPDYQMIAVKPGAKGIWGGEDLLIQTARYFCDHAALHEEAPPGFTACLIELKGDPDHDHWGGVFIAHDDFYQTPLGHPFIVNCGPIGLPCEVSYTYRYRLNLTFR